MSQWRMRVKPDRRPAGLLHSITLEIGYKAQPRTTKPYQAEARRRSLEVKAWLQGSKVDAAFYSCTEYTALNEQHDDFPSAWSEFEYIFKCGRTRAHTAERDEAECQPLLPWMRCYHG